MNTKGWRLMWTISVISIMADQISKAIVERKLMPYEEVEVLGKLLRLTRIKNTGAAFGILQSSTSFLVAVTFLVICIILAATWFMKKKDGFVSVGLGLIMGGALGNFVDRLRLGYVVDFIHLSFFWAVFNLADAFLVVGAVMVGYGYLLKGKLHGNQQGKGLEIGYVSQRKITGMVVENPDTEGNKGRPCDGERGNKETQLFSENRRESGSTDTPES